MIDYELLNEIDLSVRASTISHLPVRWLGTFEHRLMQGIALGSQQNNPILFHTNTALLLAGKDDFWGAETSTLKALRTFIESKLDDEDSFVSVLNALFVVQRLDLVAAMVRARYAPTVPISLKIEERGPGIGRQQWEIEPSDLNTFTFDATSIQSPREFHGLLHFCWIAPLLFHYIANRKERSGSTIINQWDKGLSPGLCYCDNRPDYFLIPDYVFVSTKGYSFARAHFEQNPFSWANRKPVAFWRGATTGVPSAQNAWSTLDRTRLCKLAQSNSASNLFDIGFSHISQFDDDSVISEIQNSGLVAGKIPWQDWNNYKYLVDIDGNSSPWSNLFQKLLTGSPVLKVGSASGFRQWYYDDLIEWDNFVPIAPNMSDLIEKVKWLQRNDSIAARIGQRGRELALKLDYASQLDRSVPTIDAAFRNQPFLNATRTGSTKIIDVGSPDDSLTHQDITPAETNAVCALLETCDFDLEEYFSLNGDLRSLGHNLPRVVEHLFAHGAKEGRSIPVRDPNELARGFEEIAIAPPTRMRFSLAVSNAKWSNNYHIKKYLSGVGQHCLEIGAGSTDRSGWLSTDLVAKQSDTGSVIIALDATKPFPLPECSFDFVYCEHMIEHIDFGQGLNMLRECCRILKPGGVVRIATPSIGMLLRVIAPDRSLLEQTYFNQTLKASVPDAPAQTIAFFLNNFMRNWGHKFIYDRETLELTLFSAGFRNVKQTLFGQSENPVFRNLEHADRMPPGFLELETMVFEATKLE